MRRMRKGVEYNMIVEIFDHWEYDKKDELIIRYKPTTANFKVLDVGNYLIIENKRYQIDLIEYSYDEDTLRVYCEKAVKI